MRRGAVGIAAVIVGLMLAVPAWADYAAGQEAWEAGRFAEALAEWEGAAAEGDGRAMTTLGRTYRQGVGAPQDYILAHFWFNLAASQGDVQAAAERDSLAELMSVGEQSEARELLREWRGKVQPTVEAAAPESPPSEVEADAGPAPPRAIEEAQSLLAQLDYAPGPADGIWGRRTAEAYRAFLRDAGLPTADALTPKTLRAMREIVATRGEEEQPALSTTTQQSANALHRAAKAGDVNGLNTALLAGVNANARDDQGWTALMHAANKGYTLLVSPLLKARADPDVQAADGATALFMAAVHGHSEIIALLMNAGADFSIKGPKDRTAADVARVKFGGLDAAERNNERKGVLALIQQGTATTAEIQEISSSLVAQLLKCKVKKNLKRFPTDPENMHIIFVTQATIEEDQIEISLSHMNVEDDAIFATETISAHMVEVSIRDDSQPRRNQREGFDIDAASLSIVGSVNIKWEDSYVGIARENRKFATVWCQKRTANSVVALFDALQRVLVQPAN